MSDHSKLSCPIHGVSLRMIRLWGIISFSFLRLFLVECKLLIEIQPLRHLIPCIFSGEYFSWPFLASSPALLHIDSTTKLGTGVDNMQPLRRMQASDTLGTHPSISTMSENLLSSFPGNYRCRGTKRGALLSVLLSESFQKCLDGSGPSSHFVFALP